MLPVICFMNFFEFFFEFSFLVICLTSLQHLPAARNSLHIQTGGLNFAEGFQNVEEDLNVNVVVLSLVLQYKTGQA